MKYLQSPGCHAKQAGFVASESHSIDWIESKQDMIGDTKE